MWFGLVVMGVSSAREDPDILFAVLSHDCVARVTYRHAGCFFSVVHILTLYIDNSTQMQSGRLSHGLCNCAAMIELMHQTRLTHIIVFQSATPRFSRGPSDVGGHVQQLSFRPWLCFQCMWGHSACAPIIANVTPVAVRLLRWLPKCSPWRRAS